MPVKNFLMTFFVLAVMSGAIIPPTLYAGYNIESHGTTSASIFTRIVTFMQDVVDLMDGPIAVAVVVLSL